MGGTVGLSHGALWLAVVLSVALTVEHVSSSNHAGVHETTRHAMRPEQAISW
jgi:hypothetical protein